MKNSSEKMAEQEKKFQNLITGWTVDSHQQLLNSSKYLIQKTEGINTFYLKVNTDQLQSC